MLAVYWCSQFTKDPQQSDYLKSVAVVATANNFVCGSVSGAVLGVAASLWKGGNI